MVDNIHPKCPDKKIGVICCRYSLVRYNKYNTQTQLHRSTVYPKKYAHVFVVRCFVVVMQSFIMNSHEVFIHIHQGCFAGTGTIVRLPQCQWSKPDGYGAISQCITTTKHSKAKTVCIFLGIYCRNRSWYKMIEVESEINRATISGFKNTLMFDTLLKAFAICLVFLFNYGIASRHRESFSTIVWNAI